MKIFGKVQGVFFRGSAGEKARELGLSGYAKNLPDGSVEIRAEGGEEKLGEFLEWCRKGPERAVVDRIDFGFSEEIEGFEGFETRR